MVSVVDFSSECIFSANVNALKTAWTVEMGHTQRRDSFN